MSVRKLEQKARDLVMQMLVAGDSVSAVSTALDERGFGKWSPDHIRRHYANKPEVLKAVEAARAAAVAHGMAVREERVAALCKRAQWMDESIGKLSMKNPQPAVLKTLLSEFREYSKQVAQELGEWHERRDVTSGGRAIVFNLSVLSTEEVELLGRIRAKLATLPRTGGTPIVR